MSRPVYDVLAQAITQTPQQRFTFAEFMDWVLYNPQYGYYSSGQVNIGIRGDFVTAIALGPAFGELLVAQFYDMWQRLDCPVSFDILELGAGTGAFAQSVLLYAQRQYPDFYQAIHYTIVEHSQFLRSRQKQLLTPTFAEKCQWLDWDELMPDQFQGCCFSNEFFDALPVHRVGLRQAKLQEQYITLDSSETGLVYEWDDLSTPALTDYFVGFGLQVMTPPYKEGYETEVNLNAQGVLTNIAQTLKQGWMLTIDYGYPAGKYYHPQRYSGTLQCYFQQRLHDNPLINLGTQDITAHINFTALEFWGETVGLKSLGFCKQAPFLMNLGVGERLAALSSGQQKLADVLQQREILHQLIDPTGPGKFGVLLQGKGVDKLTPDTPLLWFKNPWDN